MTIEEISKLTNLPILPLYNNYRLPRPVAKITQNYVGVNVSRYADKIYRNKEKALPHFVQFPDFTSQVQAIAEIVNNNPDSSVGILLPNNKLVIDTYRELLRLNVSFEYKFQVEGIEKKTMENLDFYSNLPKLMTYHSAKGLQFDIVILPKYDGAKSIEDIVVEVEIEESPFGGSIYTVAGVLHMIDLGVVEAVAPLSYRHLGLRLGSHDGEQQGSEQNLGVHTVVSFFRKIYW